MGAILASLGLKDTIYLVLIVVGGALGTAAWIHHDHVEQAKGADIVKASDAAAVDAHDKLDSAQKTLTALANSVANGDYENAKSDPIKHAPIPDRLCNFALGSRAVPSAPGAPASGDGQADLRAADTSATSALQQFADSLARIGHEADAQVGNLQKVDTNIRTQMEKSNVPQK